MARLRLLPCPGCARHVRVDERACPFCALALTRELRGRGVRPPRPPKGASRAAVFAFQTALLAGPACTSTHRAGEEDRDERVVGDAPNEPQLDAAVAQAGGGAPALDAGRFDNTNTPAIPRQPPDVDHEDDDDGGFGPVPIYGGPFPDPRTRAKV